jgi:dolichol kinase
VLSQPHFDWHTGRKLWHISGCLTMVAVYFLWRGLTTPFFWLNFLLVFAWLVAAAIIAVDILRLYRPLDNLAYQSRLGFYSLILRQHEHGGYSSATHSILAAALIITGFYFGCFGEFVLLSAILAMALCDPAAAWGRHLARHWHKDLRRLNGFSFFVLSAMIIMMTFGWFYGYHDWDEFLVAAILAALAEAYIGRAWNRLKKIFAVIIEPLGRQAPLWLSGFYPDDNLTVPLTLALTLMFLGY